MLIVSVMAALAHKAMYFANNWIKCGFGSNLGEFSSEKAFYLSLRTNISKPQQNAFINAVLAAHQILDQYPQPINVLLSGGIDSQAMVSAFVATNRLSDFQIVIARYPYGLNQHDIEWAEKYCHATNISYVIVDFDVITFHENELIKWGKRYTNHSPHILSHCKMISRLDGTCVLAGNPLVRNVAGPLSGGTNYSLIGTKRYAELSERSVVGLFFMFTPELTYSLLQDHGTSEHSNKSKHYLDLGFAIIKPPAKYHGFEKLKEWYDRDTTRVSKDEQRYYAQKYGSNRMYDHLFRHPLMEMVPYSEDAVCIPEMRLL